MKLSYVLGYLLKARGNNLTRILSITLGLAVGWVLLAQVTYTLSFNRDYADADRIYRVEAYYSVNGKEVARGEISAPVVPALADEMPDIEKATRLFDTDHTFIYDEQPFTLRTYYGDSTLFKLFGISVLSGNPGRDMLSPDHVFVSERTARLLFGDSEPEGKRLESALGTLIVAGVFGNLPKNSNLECDVLLPFENIKKVGLNYGWNGGQSYDGYVKLRPGTDPQALERKIPGTLQKYCDYEAQAARGFKVEYYLKPLTDIYVKDTDVQQQLRTLALLALAIMFVSAMNYVLISVSSLAGRARTMAMHKCYGAGRGSIVRMMMVETSLLVGVSMLLSGCLLALFRGPVYSLLGTGEQMLFSARGLWFVIPFIALLFLVAGLIPARIFSSVPVSLVFRHRVMNNALWKQALLFVQFAGAVLVVTLLVIVTRQYDMLLNRDLGYRPGNLLYMSVDDGVNRERCESLKNELRTLPGIQGAAYGSLPPSPYYAGCIVGWDLGDEIAFHAFLDYVDPDYVSVMGMKLLQGKRFEPNSDSTAQVIVNEEFVRAARWTDSPIGKTFFEDGKPCEVIGVIGDFSFASFRTDKEFLSPMILLPATCAEGLNIRVDTLTQESLKAVTRKLESLLPDQNIHVMPYTEVIRDNYAKENQFRHALTVGALIVLLITLIGLIGFLGDEVNRRSKEIAIRKVNGATAADVIRLVAGNIGYTALAAVLCGLLLGYWLGGRWLEQFAYKIPLSGWIFAGCGAGFLLLIATVIVVRVWKTANMNPVLSIKKE